MVDAVPLARAISERLRELRTESGMPQETVAAEARQLGLDWSRATVADIELGRRQLSIGELILLPLVLGRAGAWAYDYQRFTNPDGTEERIETGRHPVGLDDLLPDDDRPVLIAGGAQTPARLLRLVFHHAGLHVGGLLAGGDIQTPRSVGEETAEQALRLPRLWCLKMFEAIREHRKALTPPDLDWHPDHDEEFWPAIGREAAADATRKAAAVLGVSPVAVALAARARWNGVWGLVGEREHRLHGSLLLALGGKLTDEARSALERDWNLSEEGKQALSAWSARGTQERALPPAFRRKLQAVRGHFTRELLDELRPLLKDVTKKNMTKRRAR